MPKLEIRSPIKRWLYP